MKFSKSLFALLASVTLITTATAAHQDVSGSSENDESPGSLASDVAQLDTPKEQFERALELGAEPDEYGLIEFDEPIDWEIVNGKALPVDGIIDPDHVYQGQSNENLDTIINSGTTEHVSPNSPVPCGDNPSYTWIRSAGNMCFVHPGHNYGTSNTFSVSRVCTNLQGVQARTVYLYGPDQIPTGSPWRTGSGCWDFAGNVPAFHADMRTT